MTPAAGLGPTSGPGSGTGAGAAAGSGSSPSTGLNPGPGSGCPGPRGREWHCLGRLLLLLLQMPRDLVTPDHLQELGVMGSLQDLDMTKIFKILGGLGEVGGCELL